MFVLVLCLVLVAAVIHVARMGDRTRARAAEVFLVWLLVGYCGLPMLLVSVGILVDPGRMSGALPIGNPSPLTAFFGWAYLGMSIPAVLAVRIRGSFLLAPAIVWSVYLLGATLVHLHGNGHGGGHGGGLAGFLLTLATHALVGVGLAAAIALGAARAESRSEQ